MLRAAVGLTEPTVSWDVKGGQDLEIQVGVRVGRKAFQVEGTVWAKED